MPKGKFRRVSVTIALADLRGRRLAVDANGELYQFLALIRLPDGTPLKDSHGRITSHLSGLFSTHWGLRARSWSIWACSSGPIFIQASKASDRRRRWRS